MHIYLKYLLSSTPCARFSPFISCSVVFFINGINIIKKSFFFSYFSIFPYRLQQFIQDFFTYIFFFCVLLSALCFMFYEERNNFIIFIVIKFLLFIKKWIGCEIYTMSDNFDKNGKLIKFKKFNGFQKFSKISDRFSNFIDFFLKIFKI